MKSGLLERIGETVILGDGAMGTRLQALAPHYDGCLDALNIETDPTLHALVRTVHEEYRQAGADILQTNTFGANPVKLARFGLDDSVREINLAGARVARLVAGNQLLVGGSVGPMEPISELDGFSPEDVRAGFQEQMDALVEGGADFLILETFQDLSQARIAASLAKSYALPLVVQIGGVQAGRTSSGIDVVHFAQEMLNLGADIVGSNCRGPFDVLRTTEMLAQHLSCPLSAQPNAGSPEIDRGRIVYSILPEEYVDYGQRLLEAGAGYLGGCCGTDPTHIALLKTIVDGRKPVPRGKLHPRALPVSPKESARPEIVNLVHTVMDSGGPLISVEIRADRKATFSELKEGAREVVEAGSVLLDVPDNAGAMVGYDPMTTAAFLQRETGAPAIMHLNSTSRNLIALQSYLLGAWQNSIHSVLAITGDHPNVGDHDGYAQRVTDIKSSVDLIRLIGSLNHARLFNEKLIKSPTGFTVGCAINPNRNLAPQIKWLKRKIDAGATYAFSQPVYESDVAKRMYEAASELSIPIFTGILPISSARNAEFLASGRIPGISVPPEIVERFRQTDSREAASNLGMKFAEELLTALEGTAQGFYFILPFGKTKYTDTARLVKTATEVLKLQT